MSNPARAAIGWLLAPAVIWAAIACWHNLSVAAAAGSACQAHLVRSKIDPNIAPWWELAVLPGIGEITARRIVAYREAGGPQTGHHRTVFRSAGDLDAVRGIGPITIRRVAPYLEFRAIRGIQPGAAPPE